jgi:hypothetical protein
LNLCVQLCTVRNPLWLNRVASRIDEPIKKVSAHRARGVCPQLLADMTSLRSPVPAKLHHSSHDPSLHKFVCLTITASDLQDLLAARKVTSVLRVERYIEQISDRNDYLRQARTPGADRREGRTRGSLHGIPVLIMVESLDKYPMKAGLHRIGQYCKQR